MVRCGGVYKGQGSGEGRGGQGQDKGAFSLKYISNPYVGSSIIFFIFGGPPGAVSDEAFLEAPAHTYCFLDPLRGLF